MKNMQLGLQRHSGKKYNIPSILIENQTRTSIKNDDFFLLFDGEIIFNELCVAVEPIELNIDGFDDVGVRRRFPSFSFVLLFVIESSDDLPLNIKLRLERKKRRIFEFFVVYLNC